MREKWKMLVLTACCIALADASLAREGEVKMAAAWVGQGQVFHTGPDEVQFIGTFSGTMYIEHGDGSLNRAVFTCPTTQTLDRVNATTTATGKCRITAPDGESVFAAISCNGTVGDCTGSMKLTGGTGRFQGITGEGAMITHSPLTSIALDLAEGSIIREAAGLAVWPQLKFVIPDTQE